MSVFSAVLRGLRRNVQVKRRAAEMIRKHQSQAYEAAVRESANDWPSGRGQFYLDVSKQIRRRTQRGGDASRSNAGAMMTTPSEGDAG